LRLGQGGSFFFIMLVSWLLSPGLSDEGLIELDLTGRKRKEKKRSNPGGFYSLPG